MIKIYHQQLNLLQKIEDDFFASKQSMCSMPSCKLYKQILWKARPIWILEEIIKKYKLDFTGNILELGGGYGIQSAYLKTRYKNQINLYYSDASLTAVRTSKRFEDFFKTKINQKWVMEAETIPTQNNTFDAIFTFASFHHFQNPVKVISECHRALKTNGKLFMLLEPSVPKIFSLLYSKHVKRKIVPELHYTKTQYRNFLKSKFANYKLHNFTGYYNRESKQSLLYYLFLSVLPDFIVSRLPCSQVIIAVK